MKAKDLVREVAALFLTELGSSRKDVLNYASYFS